jgi:hypothetical protein
LSWYYQQPVRRGEIILNQAVVDGWKKEVELANLGKIGEPYRYPEAFMKLLGMMRILFRLPYRQLEGFTRVVAEHVDSFDAPDHSTIGRWVNKLSVTVDDPTLASFDPVTISVDKNGITIRNGTNLMEELHSMKEYMKIDFAVNLRQKQIVELDVTSSRVPSQNWISAQVPPSLNANSRKL